MKPWRQKGEMPDGVTGERSVLLSTAPAERGARRLALIVVLISVLVFIAAVPFAGVPLPQVWAFIPIYESSLAINDLITASLLFAQFQAALTKSSVSIDQLVTTLRRRAESKSSTLIKEKETT